MEQVKKEIFRILPAKWQKEGMKYLGITIYRTKEAMLEENLISIINYVQDLLECVFLIMDWQNSCGKKGLLPKLIFVFLNVILELPGKGLNKIQRIFKKFIWNNKRPQLKLRFFEKRVESADQVVPNAQKYSQAAMLSACLNWWRLPSDNMSANGAR